ncbi:hypothetical protein [Saccharothrix lopnurensis]|uniref:Uncharacterized protein n=1 Tax=Saccharothrix lopnurensis TaxID=1670621 RepID=A0ABW1PFW4_9PSEU
MSRGEQAALTTSSWAGSDRWVDLVTALPGSALPLPSPETPPERVVEALTSLLVALLAARTPGDRAAYRALREAQEDVYSSAAFYFEPVLKVMAGDPCATPDVMRDVVRLGSFLDAQPDYLVICARPMLVRDGDNTTAFEVLDRVSREHGPLRPHRRGAGPLRRTGDRSPGAGAGRGLRRPGGVPGPVRPRRARRDRPGPGHPAEVGDGLPRSGSPAGLRPPHTIRWSLGA